MKKNYVINFCLKATFMLLLVLSFGQQSANGQTCTAPNQCNPTAGFGDAPAAMTCAPGTGSATAIFAETFDGGFGIFTEDSPPGPGTVGTNDLTVSTAGDTPSAGTGPETTPGCNGGMNDGEFIFLEGSSTLIGETHCMTAVIPVPAISATTNGPFYFSFWYHMFGDNIGTFTVNVNGANEFTATGQQQTANCQPWLQGAIDATALAGTSPTVQICMTEGNGAVSTFESDISIDHFQLFACAQICELTCPAPQGDVTPLDNDPGVCGAFASVIAGTSAVCNNAVINDFNGGGANASGIYPVGTTTVTFSTVDDFGNPLSCSTTVTVADTEGPTINCPTSINIHLDPGACDAIVDYSLNATDNCNEIANANTLATLAQGGNGGGVGGMVYFDLTNSTADPLPITGFEMNIVGATMVDVYTIAGGTFNGNQGNAGAWTLVGQLDATGGPFGPFTGPGPLTPAPVVGGSFSIPPGTSAIALHTLTSQSSYTNGNGANQSYTDGTLTFDGGSASNGPFGTGGLFTPRIFNGSITYAQLVPFTPIVTTLAGLPSGSTFPIGTTTITATATDLAGNSATCSFPIIIHEYVPTSNDITCNSLVHITLDENCEATVGADQILEGDNYGCYDNYIVTNGNGDPLVLNESMVGLTIEVMVTNPAGVPCWGYILIEDKIAPTITCYDLDLDCDEALPTAVSYTHLTLPTNREV